VLVGGSIGWITAFPGLHLWGLLVGVAFTLLAMLALARAIRSHPPLSVAAAYGLAFVLLTWPILWLLVGLVRYAISGQPLGD
jgi:hypothetical protein